MQLGGKKQIENVPNALAKQMLKKTDGERQIMAKPGVIQNSIYGVDIQPIASEISKLRCFLSLIIDETIVDDAENRGIQALPNLEFKFVTANTLIGLEEKQWPKALLIWANRWIARQLKPYETNITSLWRWKIKLKKDFEEVQNKIFKQEIAGGGQNKRALQLASWNPFGNESNTWFDPYWMYGVEKFDIVIGNPPYVSVKSISKELKQYFAQKYLSGKGRLNLYTLFIERGFNILREKGVLGYIVPDNLYSNIEYRFTRKLLTENTVL